MYSEIPLTRPLTPLLDDIDDPADLRELDSEQLTTLAHELREFLLFCVGQTGGHFGAGLGVVELTLALHYAYNTPEDKLVWDVGHQTYPHKILTGRRERMLTMRQYSGLSGFPKRNESDYDTFGVGHSSTSISAALGMALADDLDNSERKHIAVIGDGAMTAGMAFEALNHAAYTGQDLLVILNDNNMSISSNEGGLASYFSKALSDKAEIKPSLSASTLFEEMGFNYTGPIDGHDLSLLLQQFSAMKTLRGPKLLHIITQKGKGFSPAEADPVGYHALTKIEPNPRFSKSVSPKPKLPKYQDVFGQWLCDIAEVDERLIGITPAMCEGSGMVNFAERFPDRFHDVAIAEQHAVTLAAGMACQGKKPVVAIYSTFLQRAYDQLIHDVAIQNLDVTFGIDRAGIVGEDGPTHSGSFDLSYLRCIPNMVIAAPSDENACVQLLNTAYQYVGPAAVRYPRGKGTGAVIKENGDTYSIGKGLTIKEGKGVAILSFGVLLPEALTAAQNMNATVCDMRWVKPLDEKLIDHIASNHQMIVTLEDNVIAGGAGSGVAEYLNQQGTVIPILNLGLPDRYIDHGKRELLLQDIGLDADGILQSIAERLSRLKSTKG